MIINRLRAFRDRLLDTLWFVPSIVVITFLLLAVGMVEVSSHVDGEVLARWPLLFGANAESSRSILASVASGMITVAGLTFSLTLLAVTQASSQYTPRILRNFLGDRANQLMLGTFVGVFAYCIVVLRTIRGGENNLFVPSLAVVLGMVLGIVGIGVLIVAVHHIASSLQASSIVSGVATETEASVDRIFPEFLDAEIAQTLANDRQTAVALAADVEAWHAVRATRSGYVQSVDTDSLVDRGNECGRLIRVECCPGDFVVEGRALAWVAIGAGEALTNIEEFQKVSRQIAQSFTIGLYRTVEQDPQFGIRQLVDIALKALSPGVNDTTTAVSCVHYLGAILTRVANRKIDAPVARHEGKVRVLPCGPSFGSMLSLSFDQIRQSAEGNVTVLALLMRTAAMVAEGTSSAERRVAAIEQLSLLRENAGRTVGAPHDRRSLRDCYRKCMTVADQTEATRRQSVVGTD